MSNERRLRLIQVAKEFNVGINTITDFLHKKGIKNDGSPNALVDADTYAVLEKEFGSNRSAAGGRPGSPAGPGARSESGTGPGTRPRSRETGGSGPVSPRGGPRRAACNRPGSRTAG